MSVEEWTYSVDHLRNQFECQRFSWETCHTFARYNIKMNTHQWENYVSQINQQSKPFFFLPFLIQSFEIRVHSIGKLIYWRRQCAKMNYFCQNNINRWYWIKKKNPLDSTEQMRFFSLNSHRIIVIKTLDDSSINTLCRTIDVTDLLLIIFELISGQQVLTISNTHLKWAHFCPSLQQNDISTRQKRIRIASEENEKTHQHKTLTNVPFLWKLWWSSWTCLWLVFCAVIFDKLHEMP